MTPEDEKTDEEREWAREISEFEHRTLTEFEKRDETFGAIEEGPEEC